ncbi:deoxyguanosinetriphosphate triphosphohydrolase family protein [Clostridium neonatale]|uniref:deoxyguanosinetriphosphate triphosphohydrolase family protein n=1 Tax=Clostridium neonatale TaxID=137838 RepID=UPI00291C07A1|nr:dNTP triphosphohydrolase [Clostridium neonatale]CAI3206529.1 dGTPase [Clostridium neonatale]CAI3210642.1 dGTPase [Clostridium neonatale]CAI3676616.1 dGTPase [Clostridium neonatale]
MKLLLVQCLRGNGIGKVKIEQMNKDDDYYYYYKKADMDPACNLEESREILFVQYKYKTEKKEDGQSIKTEEKKCCGMAIGTYSVIDIENDVNQLLKVKVKQIRFTQDDIEEADEYKEITQDIKQIDSNVLNDKEINIIQIENLDEGKINYIKSFATNNINDDKELESMIELYKEYKNVGNLDKYDENLEEKPGIRDLLHSYGKGKLISILKDYDILEREKEEGLDVLAQKSIFARRVINKGKRREKRTEYQRDWERIIHSKSFRRLEDKAQIYTLSKGDHFRTRLTHTLEVTQIARGIARELNLNEDLVEAIALGHDLGHTPFGHVGERTLNKILIKEGVEGGFKHNFQGVKVVNYLEEKYGEFEGLDLTYQVMEGILKHTKVYDCSNCKEYDKENDECKKRMLTSALECEDNTLRIEKFFSKGDYKKLHLKYNFSTTLEGQVVAVADEIAQRAHDLDDGIASGIINEEKFLEKLKYTNNLNELFREVQESLEYIDEDKRDYIDTLDINRARIVSDIITYFIRKVVEVSKENILDYKDKSDIKDAPAKELDEIVISKELVSFKYIDEEKNKKEDAIENVRRALKKITSDEIINSEEVNCFDGKGGYIIKKLYKAYITNPKQMAKTTRKRIEREISKYTNEKVDISKIYIQDYKENDKLKYDELKIIEHKIFVRCIIDLIAGMTDEFANKQFQKLYYPRTY